MDRPLAERNAMGKQPKPLTPKMFAVLSELAKPKAIAYYMGYMGRFGQNAYYFLSTSMKHCTAQINGLVARELVELFDIGIDEHKVRISAAGRKFLKGKP